MNEHIHILTTATLNEAHRPIELTPEQAHIVNSTPANKLFLALFQTGLRDFIVIQDNTPSSDLTPEQIATKIGCSLEEFNRSTAQVSPKRPQES